MSDVRSVISGRLDDLAYYMEDENIPSSPSERLIYYRKSRSYLADCLTELYMLLLEKERDFCKSEAVKH